MSTSLAHFDDGMRRALGINTGDGVLKHSHLETRRQRIEHRILQAVVRGEAADVEMRDSALPQVCEERLAFRRVTFESRIARTVWVLALGDGDRGRRQTKARMKACAVSALDAVRWPGSTVRLEVRRDRRMPVARHVHRGAMCDGIVDVVIQYADDAIAARNG